MRLTKIQVNEIISDYLNGFSITEISKKFNVSSPSICWHLDKFPNIERNTHLVLNKKYKLDDFFFKEIDSERKAYWLGFLYADGYNHTKKHVVKISLQERDGYILEELRKDLKYNKNLSFYKKKTQNSQNQIALVITDKRTSLFLEKLGMVQNKSHILKFPKFLEEELIIHFIRGVFDGDGFISDFKKEVRNDSCVFSITGAYDICYNIGEYFKRTIGTSYSVKPSRNSFALYIGGRLQIAKIHKYLYLNSTIFLKRKKERFEKWETYKRIPTIKNNIKRINAARENGIKYKKPISQYSLDMILIKEWDGIIDIARHFNNPKLTDTISKCARGVTKSSYGYIWKFN